MNGGQLQFSNQEDGGVLLATPSGSPKIHEARIFGERKSPSWGRGARRRTGRRHSIPAGFGRFEIDLPQNRYSALHPPCKRIAIIGRVGAGRVRLINAKPAQLPARIPPIRHRRVSGGDEIVLGQRKLSALHPPYKGIGYKTQGRPRPALCFLFFLEKINPAKLGNCCPHKGRPPHPLWPGISSSPASMPPAGC